MTLGRAYCEAAGYRWSREYGGWVIEPGGMDPAGAIAYELSHLIFNEGTAVLALEM